MSVQGLSSSQAANDLLDQRDKLVRDLSELIDVETIEQENGSLNVFIGKGIALVVDAGAQRITTVRDEVYPERLSIQIGEGQSTQIVRAELQGGAIGGLNEFVGETLHPTMQDLGHLALNIADVLNEAHNRGFDINGSPGADLFATSDPQVYSNSGNTGNGVITASIDDVSALVSTDYVLKFDGANFNVTRNSDGAATSGTLPLSVDGMNINLTGTPVAGDVFVVSPTGRAALTMNSLLDNPDDIALSGQLSTSSAIQNIGDAKIGAAMIADPDNASLTAPIDIIFTDDSTYDIVDASSNTVLSSGNSYVDGAAISYNGWDASISGNAKDGDAFSIGPNINGRGNNANGQALVALQNELTIGGTVTFNDAYGSLVARVGSQTSSSLSRSNALEALKDSAIDRQQSLQGVSLDEEAVDLTRYQQAYQASAQIISVAEDMFQTVLGAVR